ncbi:DUF3060 domain-containing protein [Deinococcus sp.]|uniref:DUF3060 domain-containing protein n=1 Tax=Deinococcus sp. TaxID=47478 RepID=UPI003C7B9F97
MKRRSRLLALLLGLTSAALAQSATMTVPGLGRVIAGNGSVQSLRCSGDALTVSGNSNRLTLTGTCTRLTVNGNRNVISAATVGEIVVDGNSNTVSWHTAIKGLKPLVNAPGSGNKITKK